MNLVVEEEGFTLPVVPSAAGRKHIVVFPEVDVGVESGFFEVGAVVQRFGLDEDGVSEHIDLVGECEETGLGVVGAVDALDNLAVFVFHSGSAGKDCNTVLGVVVEVAGTQDVVFFVYQLDYAAPEFCEVLVHEVVESLAGEHGSFLHQLDVADCIDDVVGYAP